MSALLSMFNPFRPKIYNLLEKMQSRVNFMLKKFRKFVYIFQPLGFWALPSTLAIRFFDLSTPSMRIVENGREMEKKGGERGKKQYRK